MNKEKLQQLAGITEMDRMTLSPQIDPEQGRQTYAVGAIINNVAKGLLEKPQAARQLMDQGYTDEEVRRVLGDF